MPNLIDLSSQRFGTFTVLGRSLRSADARSAWWLVGCDCGAEMPVRGDRLRAGSACPRCTSARYRSRVKNLGGLTLPEFIEANSELVTECGCRIWTGHTDRYGYGRLYFEGKLIGAHRASWIASRGPIPDGLFVLHRCDLPPCINEDHLFLGTNADNIADYWAKRRRLEWLKRHYA